MSACRHSWPNSFRAPPTRPDSPGCRTVRPPTTCAGEVYDHGADRGGDPRHRFARGGPDRSRDGPRVATTPAAPTAACASACESMSQANQVPAEPDPRPALLARYTEIVRDAERRSDALFNLKPRARVEVRRVPPLTEATASAYYSLPAPDGTRPGIFWVPMRGPVFSTLSMRSLAYHEAVRATISSSPSSRSSPGCRNSAPSEYLAAAAHTAKAGALYRTIGHRTGLV